LSKDYWVNLKFINNNLFLGLGDMAGLFSTVKDAINENDQKGLLENL